MEEIKRNEAEINEREIVFSKSIKAGKRIYYIDVKKNRKEELFLSITESKKLMIGEGDDAQIRFEKHKIFLYQEDFEKFLTGLHQAIDFINEKKSPDEPADDQIQIDIDFDFEPEQG
jgi:hypothetical protein